MKSFFTVLGGLCFSVALGAQELTIKPAVEVLFLADPAARHQLETSANLQLWASADKEIVARGGEIRTVVSATNQTRFFRLKSTEIRNLNATLETIRAQYKTPALACAVIRSNSVIALGVTGNRKWNVPEPATLEDKWHQGSLTKSMTATLAALLVDEGKISWTTTVGSIFPDLSSSMHASWKEVTLEQLLSHRAGAPGDLNANGLWTELWNHGGAPREQREFLLRRVTATAPTRTPGSGYTYSNASYAIAGAMLEKIEGMSWEALITKRLFQPLGMHSAGFGVPATPRYVNHPWGHMFINGSPSPMEPGRDADNPPSIGPGGTVHCTLLDMAAYVAFHVEGARGQGVFLKPDTFRKLYTDVSSQGYGLGWNVSERPWAGGRTLNHTGSNNQWYTNVWIAPNKDFAIVILTNAGGDIAFQRTDAVAGKMIELFL